MLGTAGECVGAYEKGDKVALITGMELMGAMLKGDLVEYSVNERHCDERLGHLVDDVDENVWGWPWRGRWWRRR